MAVFGARAVAVAMGVPAVFAVLASVLALGSPVAPASAAEPIVGAAPQYPWSVERQLVRSAWVPMAVSFRLRTTDPVVFITIDDGVDQDARGLRYVEAIHLPVTAFLTTWTIKDSTDYFARITRWGSVQNHSATHASFTRSSTDLDHEICYAQRTLTKGFGSRPWLLRPPYGEGSERWQVQDIAARCGINHIVLWDAVVADGKVTQTGALRAGAVLLLHFTPHLEKDLKAAVRAARDAGLTPASLADYLREPK